MVVLGSLKPNDPERGVIFARKQPNDVLIAQVRALSAHAIIFAYWLIVSLIMGDMFLYFGAAMWLIGAIACKVLPNERDSIIRNTQRFVVSYSSLIIFKIFVYFVTQTPTSQWGRALGLTMTEAFTTTALNYITMVFWISSFGIPLAYLTYVVSVFFTFRSNVDVRERTRQIVRTGEQRTLADRKETRERARRELQERQAARNGETNDTGSAT